MTHDLVRMAKEGLVDEIRNLAKVIMELDNSFVEGGGLRTLAVVYLKFPSIPFVLQWSSKDKALELLRSANEIAPLPGRFDRVVNLMTL